METLVTGASGFVGKKLVASLRQAGHSVQTAGRTLPALDTLPRLEAVVHLMGEPIAQRWTDETKRRIRASRIDTTRQLVEAMSKLSVKPAVLVSSSAVGFYGDRGGEMLTEDSPPGKGFLAEVCQEWEAEARRAEALGIRVVLIRTATVLGKEGGALPKMALPFQFGLGAKFGDGRQWSPWIHLDDLVRLYWFAIGSKAVSGPLNGCAPQAVTNAEFTKALAQALHRPAFLAAPKWVLRAALGEMASFLFDSMRVVPERTVAAGFQFEHPQLPEGLRSALD